MLSIVINVKNGQKYLHRCLNALTRFDNVVLLDNYSTDATISIAKKYSNVVVHTSEFMGMGKVRNLAAGFARYEWVFFVDSDEVLSVELVDFLLDFTFTPNTIYQVRRYNFYNGYKLESSTWENDWILRIYNRYETYFVENEVHDSIKNKGMQIKRISIGGIYHFPYENVNGLIDKMQFYSSLYAKQFLHKKKPYLCSIPLRAFFMFIKSYILKRGFLDGYEGFVVSSYNAIGVFSKYIKLYELQHRKKAALAFYLDDFKHLDKVCEAINSQLLLPELVVVLIDNFLDREPISAMLGHKLAVDYDVLVSSGIENIQPVLEKYLKRHEQLLQYIAYIDDVDLLKNTKAFYKIRKNTLNKKVTTQIIYQMTDIPSNSL